jgi:type IV pilus assembly protein PilQ
VTEKSELNVLSAPPIKDVRIDGFFEDIDIITGLAAVLSHYQLGLLDQETYFQIYKLDQEQAQQINNFSRRQRQQPEAQEEEPELRFENGLFRGIIRDRELKELIVELALEARRSLRFLDEPSGTVTSLYVEGETLERVLARLFLGTPFSFNELDDIILIGNKTNPILTTSELIRLDHMNAQNALAYLTGESGLFQTYSLPPRPSTFGANTRRTGEAIGGSNRGGGLSTPSLGGSGGGGIQAPSNPLSGVGDIRREVSVSDTLAADITLIREHNALMITATKDIIAELRARLKLIDRPVPQVLIQTLVVDYSNDATNRWGLDITNGTNTFYPDTDVTLNINRETGGNFNVARLPSNFQVRLRALAQEGKARIISKPHIATLSGHEAYIEVGETQSILLTTETLVGDDTPRTSVSQRIETVEANISLRVVPWVTASGEITTYIEPVFNSFLGQISDNVPPPISTRRLQSTVRLKNGETIIMGGLIEEAMRNNTEGIPGLSRIPLIGNLFKNQNRTESKSELVIYLTPYVYYGDEGSAMIIEYSEGLAYPLDVQEQKELIKVKKKPWWRSSRFKSKESEAGLTVEEKRRVEEEAEEARRAERRRQREVAEQERREREAAEEAQAEQERRERAAAEEAQPEQNAPQPETGETGEKQPEETGDG